MSGDISTRDMAYNKEGGVKRDHESEFYEGSNDVDDSTGGGRAGGGQARRERMSIRGPKFNAPISGSSLGGGGGGVGQGEGESACSPRKRKTGGGSSVTNEEEASASASAMDVVDADEGYGDSSGGVGEGGGMEKDERYVSYENVDN